MPTEAIGRVLDGSTELSSTLVFSWIIALQRRTVERHADPFCVNRVSA